MSNTKTSRFPWGIKYRITEKDEIIIQVEKHEEEEKFYSTYWISDTDSYSLINFLKSNQIFSPNDEVIIVSKKVLGEYEPDYIDTIFSKIFARGEKSVFDFTFFRIDSHDYTLTWNYDREIKSNVVALMAESDQLDTIKQIYDFTSKLQIQNIDEILRPIILGETRVG